MATLHIDEYSGKGVSYSRSSGVAPNTVHPKKVKTQAKITTSNASQQSAAVDEATAFVKIRPVGGNVYIKIGPNPTASAADTFLPDGEPYDIAVETGDKIAVINA